MPEDGRTLLRQKTRYNRTTKGLERSRYSRVSGEDRSRSDTTNNDQKVKMMGMEVDG